MDIDHRITEIRTQLLSRHELLDGGMNDRRLRAELRGGSLIRIAHGYFMLRGHWEHLRPEAQLLARTLAVARRHSGKTVIFCLFSAAAIWGLPLYGYRAGKVHVLTSTDSPGRSTAGVVRHPLDWEEDEIREVCGLLVTDPARTLTDLARRASVELAIGCADAAARCMLGVGRDASSALIEEWRAAQLDRLAPLRGLPGIARARRVVAFTDPRADSVAESVSRLQLARLRVEHDIQIRVPKLGRGTYWVDFDFTGQRTLGEVDGLAKYTDPELLGGQSAQDAVLAEKKREDEIRGITRKSFVRWTSHHIGSPQQLGHRLRAFGITVPGMR